MNVYVKGAQATMCDLCVISIMTRFLFDLSFEASISQKNCLPFLCICAKACHHFTLLLYSQLSVRVSKLIKKLKTYMSNSLLHFE